MATSGSRASRLTGLTPGGSALAPSAVLRPATGTTVPYRPPLPLLGRSPRWCRRGRRLATMSAPCAWKPTPICGLRQPATPAPPAGDGPVATLSAAPAMLPSSTARTTGARSAGPLAPCSCNPSCAAGACPLPRLVAWPLLSREPVCPLCARWPRAAPGRLLALWPAGLFPYVYVYVCVARVGVFPLGPLRCVA